MWAILIVESGKTSLRNNIWEKLRGGERGPGEGKGKCKGPEADVCMMYLRTSKEAREA